MINPPFSAEQSTHHGSSDQMHKSSSQQTIWEIPINSSHMTSRELLPLLPIG